VIPPLGHFQKQWTNACKGDLKTTCDFDYSGTLIDAQWPSRFPPEIGSRLQELLDDPDG
jgi:hypothetical protein